MERLATAVKLAAKLREESYDKIASINEIKRVKLNRSPLFHMIDFSQFYKISLYDAVNQATQDMGFDKRGTQPIYLLLKYCWNDALEWTNSFNEEIKGTYEKTKETL